MKNVIKFYLICSILFINILVANSHQDYKKKSDELSSYLNSLIQKKKESNLFITLSLSQNPNIKKALKLNDPNLIDLKEIETKMRKSTKFKHIWFQIIAKDGKSFKRSWTSKKGDNLKNARPEVQSMIQNQRIIESISTGKFDMTFKSMIPIFDENTNFIGIFETITHFNSISQELRQEGIESVILVDKSYKKQLTKAMSKTFIDNYYVANLDVSKQLLKDLSKNDITKYLKIFSSKDYILDYEHNTMTTYMLLKDSNDKPMGHFLLFYPIDEIQTINENKVKINLTTIEKEYIKNNKIISFTGDPNWLPFEAFNESGQYVGIVSDHLKYIENLLDIEFNKIVSTSWTNALDIAIREDVDVISGDASDKILHKKFKPIDSYIKNPIMIIMNSKYGYVENINDIRHKRIAIIKDYGYTSDIFKNYPDIDFIEVENIQDGLLGVETKKYDAMLSSLALASYTITQLGLEDIAIVGKTNIMMNVTLFVNKNKPILHSIINKTIKSMSKVEHQKILLKWKHANTITKIDYSLIWKILVVVFIIFIVIIRRHNELKNYNKELYKQIKDKEKAEEKLEKLNNTLEQKVEETVKALESEQLEHEKNIVENTKFSTIGKMAAGITHEINTPLTYIKGAVEMSRQDLNDMPSNQYKQILLDDNSIIMNGIKRIGIIVESMREVSQVTPVQRENKNIYSSIITVLRMIHNRSKQISPIYVNNELFILENSNKEKYEFLSSIHRQRCEQVWTIILNNALDELIKIGNYEHRRIDINISKKEDKVQIEFLDNASGIPEDIIDNIFEPFVSTKESSGIGIGLNVAKKIIDEHNAIIEASNTTNGACFKIII